MDNNIIAFIILSLYALRCFCLQCKFDLGPYTYDICPLIFIAENSSIGRVVHIQHDAETLSTGKQTTTYDIDLGGDGLYYDPSLPSSQQCPEGTWICMKISSNISSVIQILPLAGNIQYDDFHGEVDAEAHLSIPSVEHDISSLDIMLKGGYYLSRPQRVRFLFTCDENAEEPTFPVIKESTPTIMVQDVSDVYTHTFTWRSRHACPIKADNTMPQPIFPWLPSFFLNEKVSQEEETAELRPNRGKTAGIVIGSLAGACALLGGVYYLNSRRSRKAYDTPSLQELLIQWVSIPAYYLQQIPLPSMSFSSIRSFLMKPFSRNGTRPSRYRYNPLFAEEYEIQDRDEEDGAVVDLQAQHTASRINASRGSMGYGSI